MRIMLDTNILISAIIFDGKIERLLKDLRDADNQLVISDYVDKEFKEKVNKKWSNKAEEIFAEYANYNFKIYPSTDKVLGYLRDRKDVPVLSDAIFHKVDVLLTGDKDFLESGITNPLIMSPTILAEYMRKNL